MSAVADFRARFHGAFVFFRRHSAAFAAGPRETMWRHRILGVAAGLLMAVNSTSYAHTPEAGQLVEPSCEGELRETDTIEKLRKAIADVNAGMLKPGSVIRLLASIYLLDEKGRPLSLKDVTGTSEKCPITIEGAGSGAVIDGARYLETHYFRVKIARSVGLNAIEYVEKDDTVAGLRTEGFPSEELINCLKIKRASWVVIRNLTIRNCWPSALFIRDASYVTLQDTTIVGASYAVVAYGNSDHILIEGNDWTQDASRDMWARIPWGVSHHGSKGYFNGALFGSKDIKGGVIVRNNTIRDAYNGVRMKAKVCKTKTECRHNLNVEIYGNSFLYVRDNPIEPEGYAANWWIHDNQIHNAHAWFSFDHVYGGPHYIFGNIGWFDEVPGRACEEGEWLNDKDTDNALTSDAGCGGHRDGKVLKVNNFLQLPLYVFHNSWYLRSSVAGGGRSGPLRHWNNAIEFCKPRPGDENCRPIPFFTTAKGDAFLWNEISHTNYRIDDYDFRNDLSNHPSFPEKLRADGFPVNGKHAEDMGFQNGAAGNFKLRRDSPARGGGCVISWSADNLLACAAPVAGSGPDVGAYQGDKHMKGPAFRHADGGSSPDDLYVERPRIVDIDWSRFADGRLALTFSVPIAYGEPRAPVTLRLKNDAGPVTANCEIGGQRSAVLSCTFPGAGFDGAFVDAILLPRQIVRRDGVGAPVTLWARTDARVHLAE